MATDIFSEDSYEQTLIDLFKRMGYRYECGHDVERDFREPWYVADLKQSLRKLNPKMSDEVLTEAYRIVTYVNLRAIGGVRQSLNYKDFAFIQCIIPPLYVVEEFNAIYDHLLVMQRHTGEECDRLAQLRDTLLPKLMSGEIKVGDVTL